MGLEQAIINRVNGLIVGKTPASDMALFSTVDHSTPTYTPNATRWTGAHTPYCAAAGRGNNGIELGTTLISSQYVIGCAHAPLDSILVGETYRWVGNDGVIYSRTVSSRQVVYADGNTGQTIDLIVGKLSSALPAEVPPALALPTDWRDYIPNALGPTFEGAGVYSDVALPLVLVNQDLEAAIRETWYIEQQAVSPTYAYTAGPRHNATVPETSVAEWEDWAYANVTGDSGFPGFFLLNQGTVLITLWSGINSGPSIAHHLDDINQSIEDLGGTEADHMQAADLSLEAAGADFHLEYARVTLTTALGARAIVI